jgi:hypothetical protein
MKLAANKNELGWTVVRPDCFLLVNATEEEVWSTLVEQMGVDATDVHDLLTIPSNPGAYRAIWASATAASIARFRTGLDEGEEGRKSIEDRLAAVEAELDQAQRDQAQRDTLDWCRREAERLTEATSWNREWSGQQRVWFYQQQLAELRKAYNV